ncbi:hypothetical protein AVEN_208311-1 [Araneus ventricosus]|uniref:Uncharacterized protein n=1 Tax=Araneus ventricosus TaxID=182803 RepID=A0A4Y2SK74_ARAVE|nr:hypothetical protein AVEN_208311-1 [Araneus ventricosus]
MFRKNCRVGELVVSVDFTNDFSTPLSGAVSTDSFYMGAGSDEHEESSTRIFLHWKADIKVSTPYDARRLLLEPN